MVHLLNRVYYIRSMSVKTAKSLLILVVFAIYKHTELLLFELLRLAFTPYRGRWCSQPMEGVHSHFLAGSFTRFFRVFGFGFGFAGV